jgi:hypothetical protein
LSDASIPVLFLDSICGVNESPPQLKEFPVIATMAVAGTLGMAYGIAYKIFLPRLAERPIPALDDPADTGGEVRDAFEVRAELRGRIADECAAAEVVAPRIPEQGSWDGVRDREPDAAESPYGSAWIDILPHDGASRLRGVNVTGSPRT